MAVSEIDIRAIDIEVLPSESDAMFSSPELDRFWRWYLGHCTSWPKTKIEYCRRFVDTCEKKLVHVTDTKRRRQILAGAAAARSRLGSELTSVDDPVAVSTLSQAVVEACTSLHPETAYNALHALALYYQIQKDYDTAELLFIRSIPYAGYLGAQMVGLVFNRVGHIYHMRGDGEKAALLEQWQSINGPMPLTFLLKRAKTLSECNLVSVLEAESEIGGTRSCWHIGRAIAACTLLGRETRSIDLCKDGLAIATSEGNDTWLRSFDQFLSGKR
jgi:hypothetical protein